MGTEINWLIPTLATGFANLLGWFSTVLLWVYLQFYFLLLGLSLEPQWPFRFHQHQLAVANCWDDSVAMRQSRSRCSKCKQLPLLFPSESFCGLAFWQGSQSGSSGAGFFRGSWTFQIRQRQRRQEHRRRWWFSVAPQQRPREQWGVGVSLNHVQLVNNYTSFFFSLRGCRRWKQTWPPKTVTGCSSMR